MTQYDSWVCNLYGLPYPIYFYYYSKSAFPDWEESTPIGNCPSIVSVQFTPYIEFSDLNIKPLLYDVERFGKLSPMRPQLDRTPGVWRVNYIEETSRVKTLGTVKTYPQIDKQIGGTRYWKNESKLFNYPYSYAILTDGISPPFQIKYHLVNNNNMEIKVRNTLSDRCSYGIFISNYKGDKHGQLEAIVSGDIHELPCSSSAYNQWYASSKNSTAQSVQNTINQSFITSSQTSQMTSLSNRYSYINQGLGLLSGGIGGLGSIVSGNLLGGVGSITSGLNSIVGGTQQRAINNLNNQFAQQQANFDRKSAIQGAMSQVRDLNNTPNTLLSMGSDFIYGYNKQGSSLKLYRFGLTTEYAVKLGDYFALYGYKQNKIMNLKDNMRTRYYYNYIKTIGANITSKGDVEKDDIDILKSIFDNGVTIWHIDRDNVTVSDYSMDNYEY